MGGQSAGNVKNATDGAVSDAVAGAVLSTVATVPAVYGAVRAVPVKSVIAGEVTVRSSLMVPSPDPVLTVTVRVLVPSEPVMPVTDAPVTAPVVVRVKLPVATPFTASAKVTVKSTVAALVTTLTGKMELTVGAVSSTLTPVTGAEVAALVAASVGRAVMV